MNEIGLIFDMDGVLIENHEYHYKAWQKTASKYGTDFDEAFYREHMNGRTLAKLMDVVFPGNNFTKEQSNAIGQEKEAVYRELYGSYRKPASGLITFLEAAKSLGIPMAVGTSAPVENVTFTLDDLDLRKYFVGVVDASMVSHGKPDPEVYLKCAAMLQRNPSKCIVFEDAVSGIEAGKRAGAKVIGLATSHERHELDADLVFDTFETITIDHVKQLLLS